MSDHDDVIARLQAAPVPDPDGARVRGWNVVRSSSLDVRPSSFPPGSCMVGSVMRVGTILLNMDGSRARLGFLRREPRLSLTVLDAESWYSQVNLDGRVAELVDDERLEDIDRLARHYTGRPFRDRESHRVSAWVEVERWHVWT